MVPFPTAYAMGYIISPAPRAEFINELLVQDTHEFSAGFMITRPRIHRGEHFRSRWEPWPRPSLPE